MRAKQAGFATAQMPQTTAHACMCQTCLSPPRKGTGPTRKRTLCDGPGQPRTKPGPLQPGFIAGAEFRNTAETEDTTQKAGTCWDVVVGTGA